jgi:hypothetical protein
MFMAIWYVSSCSVILQLYLDYLYKTGNLQPWEGVLKLYRDEKPVGDVGLDDQYLLTTIKGR